MVRDAQVIEPSVKCDLCRITREEKMIRYNGGGGYVYNICVGCIKAIDKAARELLGV